MNSIVSTFPLVLTTDAAGAGTVSTTEPVCGYVLQLRAPTAASQLTTGGSADFTLTDVKTGGTILSASNLEAPFERQPRKELHTTAGGTATQPAYLDRGIPVDSYVKLVVAQGALSQSGTVFLTVEGRGR